MKKLLPVDALLETHQDSNHRAIRASYYVFFPTGGISRYTHQLVTALNNMEGLSGEVLCSSDYGWKNTTAYPCWTGLNTLSHSFSVFRRLKFLYGQFTNPVRGIIRAKENGSDVIHFSNINQLSFPQWKNHLAKSGLKMAVTVHDVRRRKGIVNKQWEKKQLQEIYRFADLLFVHSSYQAEELFDFAGITKDKIYKVPHGPYEHANPTESRSQIRTRLGLNEQQQAVLFFGQIRDDKNLDVFIRAMASFQDSMHLIVAGRSGGRHRNISFYKNLVNSLGLDKRVTFIPGFIPDEEVSNLFIASDWIALPYKNSFTSQSGVLNVAAHYHKPVLASSAPVLQETVRDSEIGIACEGDTLDALVEGIEQMKKRIDEGYEHKFYEYLNNYSWHENARITLEAYKKLVIR